jgi:hypothetical protein
MEEVFNDNGVLREVQGKEGDEEPKKGGDEE